MDGTDLFRETIAHDYGDEERRALMEEVWSHTPFMADVYTGSSTDERDILMREWCRERFGPECWPIHGHAGAWQRGSCTIYGWTWYGFRTDAMLCAFLAAWPTPDGVAHP